MQMRIKFKIAAFIVVTMLFLSCNEYTEANISIGKEGEELPNISLLLVDSCTTIKTNDLKANKSIVIIYFSPDTTNNQHLINEVKGNLILMKEVQFVLVTNKPFNAMRQFAVRNGLTQIPNIIVGNDTTNNFYNYYKPSEYPYIAFYNKEHKLRGVYSGNMDIIKLVTMARMGSKN